MTPARQASGALEASPRELEEILETYAHLQQAEARFIGPAGNPESLPNNLYSFLLRVLSDLHAGRAVTILQNKHELTSFEAARVLGMSRQFLVRLLEKGEIAFHMVGTHRRLYVRDVFAYKAKRDSTRRKILDDLARTEFAKGDYDKIPDDFHSEK